jgi:hypothetical protein
MLAGTLASIGILTALGPAERSLGTNVRVVYLHGAWVWVALITFAAAGMTGLAGLVTDRHSWQRWSLALGRTGLLFWILYLPLSVWAMQTNWNGLFLAEPRWRVAIVFAIGGLLLQIGLVLIETLYWAAAANLVYFLLLAWVLGTTEAVMHPGSPIFGSGAASIQFFFLGLLALSLFAAWQVARWFIRFPAKEISR